jgi:TIR domain
MSSFISYSREDTYLADRITTVLLRGHIKFWQDTNKLLPGDALSDRIMTAIESSTSYVLLVSQNSNRSPWVARELEYALGLEREGKLSIIPVVIAPAQVPPQLTDHLYVDLVTGNFERESHRLVTVLRNIDEPKLRVGRTTDGTGRYFTDHAVECFDGPNDEFRMNVDIVSYDLEENYIVLSQFSFVGQQPFDQEKSKEDQIDDLLTSCADSFHDEPAFVTLSSLKVYRDTFAMTEGVNTYVVTARIRRLGQQTSGHLVHDVGSLFAHMCDRGRD